jgi:hypothetical protein
LTLFPSFNRISLISTGINTNAYSKTSLLFRELQSFVAPPYLYCQYSAFDTQAPRNRFFVGTERQNLSSASMLALTSLLFAPLFFVLWHQLVLSFRGIERWRRQAFRLPCRSLYDLCWSSSSSKLFFFFSHDITTSNSFSFKLNSYFFHYFNIPHFMNALHYFARVKSNFQFHPSIRMYIDPFHHGGFVPSSSLVLFIVVFFRRSFLFDTLPTVLSL